MDPIRRGMKAISGCTRIDQIDAALRYFDLALRRRSDLPQTLVIFFSRAARARARTARRRLINQTTTAEVAA